MTVSLNSLGRISSGGGGGSPASPDTSIQFNNGGSFGGIATFYRDPTTGNIGIGTASAAGRLHSYGDGTQGTYAGSDWIISGGSNALSNLKIVFNGAGASTLYISVHYSGTEWDVNFYSDAGRSILIGQVNEISLNNTNTINDPTDGEGISGTVYCADIDDDSPVEDSTISATCIINNPVIFGDNGESIFKGDGVQHIVTFKDSSGVTRGYVDSVGNFDIEKNFRIKGGNANDGNFEIYMIGEFFLMGCGQSGYWGTGNSTQFAFGKGSGGDGSNPALSVYDYSNGGCFQIGGHLSYGQYNGGTFRCDNTGVGFWAVNGASLKFFYDGTRLHFPIDGLPLSPASLSSDDVFVTTAGDAVDNNYLVLCKMAHVDD